jgi:hypothetical protein
VVPLVETINRDPNPNGLPTVWATVLFAMTTEERVSLGSPACWREVGEILVICICRSGEGDAPAVDAAEQVRAGFRDWSDATGALQIIDTAPPVDTEFGDSRGRWYAVEVPLGYRYDRVI